LERKRLLYLISSDQQVSPFDINMAYDAGFDAVVPYASVPVSAVTGLVQDVMFSRGPKGARASAVFFSGSDLTRAEEMLAAARAALFDPFRVGLMVDPHGGYTTGAAIAARVATLARARGLGGSGSVRALVAAGTGGVGRTTAALLAREGLRVTLTSRRLDGAEAAVREIARLFAVEVTPRGAPNETELARLAAEAEIIIATGAPGVELLSRRTLEALRGPKVLADVNAVPPAGLEGLKPQDDGVEVAPGLFGLGAMAIGSLKFQVEAALLRDLLISETAPVLDLRSARAKADAILVTR